MKRSALYLTEIPRRWGWDVVESCSERIVLPVEVRASCSLSGCSQSCFSDGQPAVQVELWLCSAAQTTQKSIKKNCLVFLPVDDVTSWLCLLASVVYKCMSTCGCVCREPINLNRRRLPKAWLCPLSFLLFFLLSFSKTSSQPTYFTQAQPSGKSPKKATPSHEPHVRQGSQKHFWMPGSLLVFF